MTPAGFGFSPAGFPAGGPDPGLLQIPAHPQMSSRTVVDMGHTLLRPLVLACPNPASQLAASMVRSVLTPMS